MASSQALHDVQSLSPVHFEELTEIEHDLAATEVELLRVRNELQAPLFAKRAALIARLVKFWALVFDQAPQEIDQHISPADAVALASLNSLEVTHFEIATDTTTGTPGNGDPRSVSFTFKFAKNDYFTDEVLVKKFWYRRADDGWTGLVSEPVKIHWKDGKDLTNGMLDLAVRVWEREVARAQSSDGRAGSGRVEEYDQLVKEIEKNNTGLASFFSWFAYRGREVTSEESARATKKEDERREMVKKGSEVGESTAEHGAKGKERAEEEHGEATKEASEEEQSESDKGNDEENVDEDEYMSTEENVSEEGEVSSDKITIIYGNGNMSEEEKVSSDENMSTEGNATEEENMSEDQNASDDHNASEDAHVSDSGHPLLRGNEREIFPAGEDLAFALSEDLFSGAIKYFFDAHTEANAASEPSDASDLSDQAESKVMDQPDLDDAALVHMVQTEDNRAKKRKRV